MDLLDSIHGSCWFTKLNLSAGYHQICIAAADRQQTAFTTKFGLYVWCVLQCGLVNTQSQFMRKMNVILEWIQRKFIIIYLDDIIIHSLTLAKHLVHVHEVLTLLGVHSLNTKYATHAWTQQTVNLCRFKINKDGIHAREVNTCAVMDFPLPENRTNVRGFWASLVTIGNSSDITLRSPYLSTPLPSVWKWKVTLGGNG
jgi:hypothetical protein